MANSFGSKNKEIMKKAMQSSIFAGTAEGVLNVIMDILFIKYLSYGVAGTAFGTFVSQSVSALFLFIY